MPKGNRRPATSSPLSATEVLRELRALGEPRNLDGMRRFGIQAREMLGVSIPKIRALAKRTGRSHALAAELWDSCVFEARLLASLVDEPDQVTPRQMNAWVKDLESWADCDGVCGNLFDRTPHAVAKAHEWSARPEEMVKRAGYVLMAALAVHDKTADDKVFLDFLPVIARGAGDERNFVKKAVNWALRQIGKRNPKLRVAAMRAAYEIAAQGTPPARWIASDALREFKRVAPKSLPKTSRRRLA